MSEFDANFCFPVPSALESPRLKLVPWNPAIHSNTFVNSVANHPELFNWLPFGPFTTRENFDPWFEGRILFSQTEIAFAVYDKSQGEEDNFAGMIGLLNVSPANLSAEMGFLIILPAFHRTHVASNAVGLLLKYCLDIPKSADDSSALGLRRVFWSANTLNTRSIALAQRLGMKLEGILRWDRVLPASRAEFGRRDHLREGDPRASQPGRDTARLAICWDDWLDGGRENVETVMRRVT